MAMTYVTKVFSLTDEKLPTFAEEVADWLVSVCPYLSIVYTLPHDGTRSRVTLHHQNGVSAMLISMFSGIHYYFSTFAGGVTEKYTSKMNWPSSYGIKLAGILNDLTADLAFDDHGYLSLVFTRVDDTGTTQSVSCALATLVDLHTGEKIAALNSPVTTDRSEVTSCVLPNQVYDVTTDTFYDLGMFPVQSLANNMAGYISAEGDATACIAVPAVLYNTTRGINNPMMWEGDKLKAVCFHDGAAKTTNFGESLTVDGVESEVVVLAATKGTTAYTNVCLFT